MEERIGHYTIISELGRGGMGVVYKAHEESLNRMVALKVLGTHLSEDQSFVARFKREAQSAAALNHPNIVQVHAISDFDGQHCFAMEFVNGSSISELIKENGPMDPVKAARLILQAASGLGAAHSKGIYHRDIKPANLMVDVSGLLKIADFGLALLAEGTTQLTATGMFMGTPGYLSPEQCLDEGVDQRTDIYSLGVTLYEMLTGVTPLKADSPLALLRQIIDVEPRDVGELRPEVPESLRAILKKMMAKKPVDRYQDCTALITDLQSWLELSGAQPTGEYSVNALPWQDNSSGSEATVIAPKAKSKADTVKVATMSNNRRSSVAAFVIVITLAVLAGASYAAWKYVVDQPSQSIANNANTESAQATNPGSTDFQTEVETDSDVAYSGADQEPAFAISNYPESATDQEYEDLDLRNQLDEQVLLAANEDLSTGYESETVMDASVLQDDPYEATMGDDVATANSQFDTGMTASSGRVDASSDNVSAAQNDVLAMTSQKPAPPAAVQVGTGVALVSVGEVLLADSSADYVRQTLSRHGINVIDGMSIPGVAELLSGNGGDIQALIKPNARYLVYIRADYVGERQIYFMGRSDIELQSRLNMETHDLLNGQFIGEGIHASVGYTAMSVANKVQELIRPKFTSVASQMTE